MKLCMRDINTKLCSPTSLNGHIFFPLFVGMQRLASEDVNLGISVTCLLNFIFLDEEEPFFKYFSCDKAVVLLMQIRKDFISVFNFFHAIFKHNHIISVLFCTASSMYYFLDILNVYYFICYVGNADGMGTIRKDELYQASACLKVMFNFYLLV